jgi:hypothetical protein
MQDNDTNANNSPAWTLLRIEQTPCPKEMISVYCHPKSTSGPKKPRCAWFRKAVSETAFIDYTDFAQDRRASSPILFLMLAARCSSSAFLISTRKQSCF